MSLDDYLVSQKITEQAFADQVGVTQSYIHRIRKFRVTKLSLELAARIHEASEKQIGLLELLPKNKRVSP